MHTRPYTQDDLARAVTKAYGYSLIAIPNEDGVPPILHAGRVTRIRLGRKASDGQTHGVLIKCRRRYAPRRKAVIYYNNDIFCEIPMTDYGQHRKWLASNQLTDVADRALRRGLTFSMKLPHLDVIVTPFDRQDPATGSDIQGCTQSPQSDNIVPMAIQVLKNILGMAAENTV